MIITYTLNEKDLKKLLADYYETTPGDIKISDNCPDLNRTDIEVIIDTYPEDNNAG